jgi:hypothetical protein
MLTLIKFNALFSIYIVFKVKITTGLRGALNQYIKKTIGTITKYRANMTQDKRQKRQKTTKSNNKAICLGHQYTHTNTSNVN